MMDKKLGQFNFENKHRAGRKIPHADCALRINTEYDEQRAFVNPNAMAAEQNNANDGSRVWQLDKLQRVKMRD